MYCSTEKKMYPVDVSFFLRKRYYVILGLMVGRILLTMLRSSLSICLMYMTTNETITVKNVTYVEEAEFHWSSFELGIILGAFPAGSIFSPLGGMIAPRLGGVKTLGFSTIAVGVLTILSPFFLNINIFYFIASRFLGGVFEAISFASQGELFMHWTPPGERTTLVTLASFGFSLGYLLGYPVVGYLTELYSWRETFQITGLIAILWSFLWLLTIAESPAEDKFIHEAEKNFFKQLNGVTSVAKIVHPWKQMLVSKVLWVVFVSWFLEAWLTSFVGTCLPLYFTDSHHVNIAKVGLLSSIPTYFFIIGKIPASLFADYLRRNEIWSKTKVHKVYILSAQSGAVICLIIAALTQHFVLSIASIASLCLFYSFALVSYHMLPLDIGARDSSFIMSLCFLIRGIGLTLNPIVMGWIITDHTHAEWSVYFYLLSALHVFGGVCFIMYGSGEVQPWAESKEETKEDKSTKQESGLS